MAILGLEAVVLVHPLEFESVFGFRELGPWVVGVLDHALDQ